jgi:hypothetical protein
MINIFVKTKKALQLSGDRRKKNFYHYKYIRFQWRSCSRANSLYARLENQSNSNNKYII